MVLLPALVFRAEIKGARMLEVRWEYDCLVASFTRKLDAQIPRVQCNERELKVVWKQELLGKCIEAVDRVTERTGCTNMLPS